MRWWLLNTWLDMREWLWVKLCNPPRCWGCDMPMDKRLRSAVKDGKCCFCDGDKDEPKKDFHEPPVFPRSEYE